MAADSLTSHIDNKVWKYQDFSITQILREINFGDPKSAKTADFAILGSVHLVNTSLSKVQKFIKIKIQSH